jgi:hypothetical protein
VTSIVRLNLFGDNGCLPVLLPGLLIICLCHSVQAAETGDSNYQISASPVPEALAAVLPAGKWKQVEGSVDRALAWMASRQDADGSFPTLPTGQPAVTSFCVLAFLSRGHQPGLGPYGQQLNRAIDFVISCQKPDGLFSYETPETQYISRHASHTAAYNHAIAGLMLGEVYGHVTGQRARAARKAIEKALQFTRELQIRPKDHPLDKGGWRYFWPKNPDSDLSVTAWQLMFLRSARNAEFAVPKAYVDEAMDFVRRCWDPKQGVFTYGRTADGGFYESSRGLMGAGILSLSLAGQHQTSMALTAGDWLLAHPYKNFGEPIGDNDRFFYSAYYCSQAAMQLGGRYWEGIFPPLAEAMLGAQSPDGSWPPEPNHGDAMYGNLYTTAMAVLSLTPPYQLLPVYQK